jgi:hypothetical protein
MYYSDSRYIKATTTTTTSGGVSHVVPALVLSTGPTTDCWLKSRCAKTRRGRAARRAPRRRRRGIFFSDLRMGSGIRGGLGRTDSRPLICEEEIY